MIHSRLIPKPEPDRIPEERSSAHQKTLRVPSDRGGMHGRGASPDAPRRLVAPADDAREELLQPDQVVAAVVAALGEGQHRCGSGGAAR